LPFHVLFLRLDGEQSVFRVLFLPLHIPQSVLDVLFLTFGRALPFQSIMPLAFRITYEYCKGVMNFEKLSLHF
jgi:hypothetical protein